MYSVYLAGAKYADCFRWSDRSHNTKLVLLVANLPQIGGCLMYFIGISPWMLVASRFVAGMYGNCCKCLLCCIFVSIYLQPHTHTHRFNGHFPGKPGLAGFLLDSQFLVILILSFLTGRLKLFVPTGYCCSSTYIKGELNPKIKLDLNDSFCTLINKYNPHIF